jgi:hypothetical protein
MSRARSLRSVYLALDIADAGGYPGLDVREIVSQLELFDEKNAATTLKNSGIRASPIATVTCPPFCASVNITSFTAATFTRHKLREFSHHPLHDS